MVKPLTNVTVHDDSGESFTFSPEDNLPAWAVKKITNPAVIPAKGRAKQSEDDKSDDTQSEDDKSDDTQSEDDKSEDDSKK